MTSINGIIRRKSLGRVAFIGSLYNATKDSFCGTTILKTVLPSSSINKAHVPHVEILYEYEDSFKQKFEKLGVEPELQLSVLVGLLALEGSGKYLDDVKDSFRSVKGTLIYKMTSVEENLNIYHENIKTCVAMDAFTNNSDATHVVIGIKWGANIMASFEYMTVVKENKSQVKSALNACFKRVSNSITGNGRVDFDDGIFNLTSRFSIKLIGDVIPHNKNLPQSLDDVKSVMAELPLYVEKYNDEKGVPIEYILCPLSELAVLFAINNTVNGMITELCDHTILRVDQVFDQLLKSKQRLNDLYNDAQSIVDHISDKVFDEISNHVQKFKIEEAKFRQELAKRLVRVRSGRDSISDLESSIESFQKGVLSKNSVVSFVNKYRAVSTKANSILTLKSKNVKYLDKHTNIDHILYNYPNANVYILFEHNESTMDNSSSPVYNVFRDLYNSNDGSDKFFISNTELNKNGGYPVIHHYINGKLDSDDYYSANIVLYTSNLVKFDPLPRIKPRFNPITTTKLLVSCPRGDCLPTSCYWKCFRCRQDVEYGYNEHLYCGCGESEIAHCKFKCNSSRHADEYIPYELNRLIDLLPSKTPEEINILLLGETGVGKSTFINAFVNYLKFDTLDEAKSGNLEVLISSKFILTDENYDTREIKIGNDDDDSNEQLENVGASSTQECKSYVFHAAGNKLVRLIDTPGIGDTRGLDYDKRNFENILEYISYHRHLNGICILLKPNNSRLTVVFRFCIQELLSHLHRNAKDNIVFCFTNARGTFYLPGDTLPPLKKQLEELKERSSVEIKVNRDTIYCFDNESFRFLAAIKKGISFSQTNELNYTESWKKSVDESVRLVEYLTKCPPHKVKDTLSLNNSRSVILILSKPLAEIGQLIQTNIKLIKEQQNEVKNSNQTIEELEDKMYIPQLDLEPVTLGHPRTVCTSNECVRSLRVEHTNITVVDYITHCHSHCELKNVKCNEINRAELRYCIAMGLNGKCKKCGCQWDKHMHITYENKQVAKKIIDENIKMQISKKKSDQEAKMLIIKEYQSRVDQLIREQKTINEISLKFAQFLRQNAIAAFNDAYADYLDHFISEEKIKKNADPNRYDEEILKGLETTKRIYLEQIEVIKQAIEKNDPSKPPISPSDIANLEQQLYGLPINGVTLKKIQTEAKRSQDNAFRYRENYFLPNLKLKSSKANCKNKLAKIFIQGLDWLPKIELIENGISID